MTHNIRIGNQTAFSASDSMDPIKFAIDQGFDAFEWFADKKQLEDGTSHGWDISDMDQALRREIKKTGQMRDIWFTVHAPWQANPLKAGGNELLIESLEFARDIGARLVNLHLYMDLGAEGYVEALRPVIDYAAQLAVQISIENTPLTTAAEVNETFTCLRKLGADHVGFCLDIGHANLCELTRNDYIRYMDELDPQVPLIHTHVHENYGDYDSHLTLFTGPAANNDGGVKAFISRLKNRQYQGAAILEQWPQPPELLAHAEQRLRKIIGKKKRKRHSAYVEHNKKKQTTATAPNEPLELSSKPTPNTQAEINDAPMPKEAFAADVAQAHLTHNSWRERLGWVAKRLTDGGQQMDVGDLTTLAVYLRFVGTGEAACAEDGRHFRPNHHARTAQAIEQSLTELETQDNAWVLRKIYPWLPSYSDQFQHREPLTRIRDIAHRNDIPKELKREIKHRLQNKLHRCAGPEDLKTSEEILGRITAAGADYSPPFVEQFQIFHKELTEFFNAASLESRLEELVKASGAADKKQILALLQLKRKKPRSEIRLLKLIEAVTLLRENLYQRVQKRVDAETQRLRLTDIALENYAFMLLSDYANRLEDLVGKARWEKMLRVLKAVLSNTYLSRIDQEECIVLLSELKVWCNNFEPTDPFQLRRLMATLERIRRLAEAYTDRVLELFPNRVQELGQALGVQAHAIEIFCEGDIRGNLVFQLSKLADMARSDLRIALQLLPWEILVAGEAEGRLVKIKDLQMVEQASTPMIVMLERAEGDEEIPDQVSAIILRHPIPHLSHLGVRARQKRLPFVTSDDQQILAQLEELLDQPVRLRVTTERVAWEPTESYLNDNNKQTVRTIEVPMAELRQEIHFLPLSEARAPSCGGKAEGAQRLLELAGDSSGGAFKALKGRILPFGVMQQCLTKNPKLEQSYREMVKALDRNDAEQPDYTIVDSLRELVLKIPVPDNLIQEICTFFGNDTRLAVRSSANGEDLEKFAGAGLYDSVIGVKAAHCGAAIKTVWSSLWTKRAAMSRTQAGIRHQDLHMAVLVQEMVAPDLSFIMHTVDPADGNSELALVELAVGLGETLASANQPGTPYRLQCNRTTGKTELMRHASFSFALRSGDSQSQIIKERLNYTQIPLTNDPDTGYRLGRRFAMIASFLQERLGRAQDAEGVVVGNDIYLVQTRAQQGL